MRRLSAALALLLLIALVPSVQAQDQRCFPETGQCIAGRIRQFWEQNSGLPVFGFPTTDQHEELVEGRPFQVQWFERNRLELHPENARPYDVLLGRLGVDRLQQQGRDWFTFPKGSEQPGCRHFAETGHTLCGAFLNYFRTHGLDLSQPAISEAESLALFGLPLSEATDEVSPTDGKTYLTQHFERARFELHPENQPPFDVLLGLLGNEIRATPPAPDPCADVPEPVSARIHPGKCVMAGTELSIDIFGFEPNEQIGFWLTAPNGVIVGTRGTYNIGPAGSVDGLPFSTDDLDAGVWFWVFQGTSSNHQAIAYFKVLDTSAPPPPAPPPPAPPQPKPLPPPSYNNCQADPNAAAAPNYPVQIVTVDKVAEVVTLKNVSDAAVDLSGWRMCSITGNQLHEGIGGQLAPGETKGFPHTNSGSIWNNSAKDDGALYNANGNLVSYWDDH